MPTISCLALLGLSGCKPSSTGVPERLRLELLAAWRSRERHVARCNTRTMAIMRTMMAMPVFARLLLLLCPYGVFIDISTAVVRYLMLRLLTRPLKHGLLPRLSSRRLTRHLILRERIEARQCPLQIQ